MDGTERTCLLACLLRYSREQALESSSSREFEFKDLNFKALICSPIDGELVRELLLGQRQRLRIELRERGRARR